MGCPRLTLHSSSSCTPVHFERQDLGALFPAILGSLALVAFFHWSLSEQGGFRVQLMSDRRGNTILESDSALSAGVVAMQHDVYEVNTFSCGELGPLEALATDRIIPVFEAACAAGQLALLVKL